jgi:hypothetical protein
MLANMPPPTALWPVPLVLLELKIITAVLCNVLHVILASMPLQLVQSSVALVQTTPTLPPAEPAVVSHALQELVPLVLAIRM